MLQLWPLTIHRYGLMYLFSVLIGWGILRWLGRQTWFQQLVWDKVSHILQYQLDDLITYIVLGIIVWGRLWHVLIYDPSYYLANPIEIIQIRKGGMSFVWWFIGVWLTTWYRVRHAKLTIREFLVLTDLIVLVLPIGIALGRIGNAINQELIGRVYTGSSAEIFTNLNLLRIYSIVDTQIRRNTNLLEWVGEWVLWFVVTLILWLVQKVRKLRQPWLITGGFMIFYSIIRFILEPIRDNPSFEYVTLMGQQINKTQLRMVGFMIVGMIVIYKWRKLNIEKYPSIKRDIS